MIYLPFSVTRTNLQRGSGEEDIFKLKYMSLKVQTIRDSVRPRSIVHLLGLSGNLHMPSNFSAIEKKFHLFHSDRPFSELHSLSLIHFIGSQSRVKVPAIELTHFNGRPGIKIKCQNGWNIKCFEWIPPAPIAISINGQIQSLFFGQIEPP